MPKLDLVCPAGSFPAFKKALEQGADAIYLGFRNDTNARHFAGLNFNDEQITSALSLAHQQNTQVFIAINTYPNPQDWKKWLYSVDKAADLGVDALIMADPGLLDYAAQKHPQISRHLSVQGSVTSPEGLNYFQRNFGIKRAVLPRVLSLAQVKTLVKNTSVEIEVFGFGSLCIMVEGRCHLSSWITGESPNLSGVCSPAKQVSWQENPDGVLESRLNGKMIDRYLPNEKTSYPTLCKGRFDVKGNTFHAMEEPTSLNTIDLLPELLQAGVKAIKIEGRQRSPAYTQTVTRIWRCAIDKLLLSPEKYQTEPSWMTELQGLSEGSQTTLGAYHRSWQ
ncbi:MAG: protease [Gammaproteobacteria bacterium CG22_combo_CG10-13_8_21_14_all_40_8]|nr:MAG: protease [Gammaproteobacteria bacterium CG22_combo_CG10-13_8_21_14_all_40_8]